MNIVQFPLFFFYISFMTYLIFIWVWHPGTKPVWLGSASYFRWFLSLGRKRSSSHLTSELRITIGRNSSLFGIYGHFLFKGTSRASSDVIDASIDLWFHRSFMRICFYVFLNQVSEIQSLVMPLFLESFLCICLMMLLFIGGRDGNYFSWLIGR